MAILRYCAGETGGIVMPSTPEGGFDGQMLLDKLASSGQPLIMHCPGEDIDITPLGLHDTYRLKVVDNEFARIFCYPHTLRSRMTLRTGQIAVGGETKPITWTTFEDTIRPKFQDVSSDMPIFPIGAFDTVSGITRINAAVLHSSAIE